MSDRACHRTVLALPWLLNGSLEAAERREVREHLIACPGCRAELARTREVLATVQAGRAAAAGEPAAAVARAGRVAAFRRAATGRLSGQRLAWAAMIAALVISAGNVWTAVRRAERQVVAESRLGNAPRQATQVQATQSARVARPAPEPVTHAAAAPVAAAPVLSRATGQPATHPAPARRSPSKSTKSSPSRSRPAEAISVADFEGGSLRAFDTGSFAIASVDTASPPGSSARSRLVPEPSSSSLFSGGFENGDLGEWQREPTIPRGDSTR